MVILFEHVVRLLIAALFLISGVGKIAPPR